MTVQLTVIGCSGTHPAYGRMCSSYLLDNGNHRLLLDAGNGSLANLTRVLDLALLDGVMISHLHPDHFVDLVSMAYGLRFHPAGPLTVPVWGPVGTRDMLTRHLDSSSRERFDENFSVTEVVPYEEVTAAGFGVQLFPSYHPASALSMRVSDAGTVVAYSGDSGGSDDLVDCARDADLFVCDATWSAQDGPHPQGLHLTGEGAGRHANRAGAQRLLVTHASPYADRGQVAAEAAAAFDGETILADDLQEHVL
jgi:ribonuclease BN (tRNA processing enzyme)